MRLSNTDPEDADFFAVHFDGDFLPDVAEITLRVDRDDPIGSVEVAPLIISV